VLESDKDLCNIDPLNPHTGLRRGNGQTIN
jgi:hypothetical protein